MPASGGPPAAAAVGSWAQGSKAGAATNGFELCRRVNRKIGPPKENDAFHMGNEIRGLGGKDTLKDIGQT